MEIKFANTNQASLSELTGSLNTVAANTASDFAHFNDDYGTFTLVEYGIIPDEDENFSKRVFTFVFHDNEKPNWDLSDEARQDRLAEGVQQALQLATNTPIAAFNKENHKMSSAFTHSVNEIAHAVTNNDDTQFDCFDKIFKDLDKANKANKCGTLIMRYNTKNDALDYAGISVDKFRKLVHKYVGKRKQARERQQREDKINDVKAKIEKMSVEQRAEIVKSLLK